MSAIIPPDLLQLIPPKYRAAQLVGNSEEEIARWKAERRRNFPTETVIAHKRSLEASREQRGQLAESHPMGALRRKLDSGGSSSSSSGGGVEAAGAAAAAAATAATSASAGGTSDTEAPEELPVSREALCVDTRLGVVSEGAAEPQGGGAGLPERRADTRPLCAAWRAKGRCRYGSSCRYSHGPASGAAAGGAPPAPGSQAAVCRWYLLGVCTAGKRCPYQHALAGGAPGAGPGTEATGLLRRLLAKDVQRETSMVLQGIRALVQRFGAS